ncbi:unnamed protein product [Lactuca virosa]|uniref:Elongation factor 2 n=1 Tax=Lactuca virosa TaxID=75947 RepID=A0AAU9LI22_9ASTR|nr:unnamed protein product [Lactuca virosa]
MLILSRRIFDRSIPTTHQQKLGKMLKNLPYKMTESVLHRAIAERVRPMLTINKMDRVFLGGQVDGEKLYQTLKSVIEEVNGIMAPYTDTIDIELYPEKGVVAFSCGLHGWGFTLRSFAKKYASKFHVDESKMMERLWGENYYDPVIKKWTTKSTWSPTCKRSVMAPMLTKLGVTLNYEEKELMGEALVICVMKKWLPAADELLEMIIFHLPSPHIAQTYRVDILYKGDLDDEYANAIRNCDPDGPLMLYVSKMIPASNDKRRFFAFGRVFSGRI